MYNCHITIENQNCALEHDESVAKRAHTLSVALEIHSMQMKRAFFKACSVNTTPQSPSFSLQFKVFAPKLQLSISPNIHKGFF